MFDYLKKHKNAILGYGTGLSIMALELGILLGFTYIGAPQLSAYPPLNTMLNWMLWDPRIIFNLHAMIGPTMAMTAAVYKRDWQGIKQFSKTYALTMGLTELTKYVVQRPRPNGYNNYSFFSGHTSSSFAGASYIHNRYGLTPALPLYTLAGLIGCGRVIKGCHYPTDVLTGAGVAIVLSYNMIDKYRSENANAPEQEISAEKNIKLKIS